VIERALWWFVALLTCMAILWCEVAPVPAGKMVCFEAAMCGDVELVPQTSHVPSYGVIENQ
jgi:hypothetical protein